MVFSFFSLTYKGFDTFEKILSLDVPHKMLNFKL